MAHDPREQARQSELDRQSRQGEVQGENSPQAGSMGGGQQGNSQHDATDGLKDKKPEELTPEELRLMADTMPGEGPGD